MIPPCAGYRVPVEGHTIGEYLSLFRYTTSDKGNRPRVAGPHYQYVHCTRRETEMVEHPDEDVQRANENETAEYVGRISAEQSEDVRETEGVKDPRVVRWLTMNGATQPDGVRWTMADLDRCEHGRHSIDSCSGCPGGVSSGNTFLLTPVPVDNDHPENVRIVDGRTEVRIGTMVHGEPIWVVVRDKER